MFQIKLIVFLIALTTVASKTEFQIVEGVKRSAVCLIERVAVRNRINATFQKIHQEQKNGETLIGCRLELGTEEYHANSTSMPMAKEKVSRQAYALTKYEKPSLRNRTCIVHQPTSTVKSDITLLEEYAQSIHSHVLYSEKPRHQNGTFQSEATLNGEFGSGIEPSKQMAKTAAATALLNTIGKKQVITALRAKYNQPRYHNMEPTKRLRKIIRVTELNGDGIYTMQNEVSEGTGKRIVAQVEISDTMAAGSGATFEEACSNAAANLLRSMQFNVAYTYRPSSHQK